MLMINNIFILVIILIYCTVFQASLSVNNFRNKKHLSLNYNQNDFQSQRNNESTLPDQSDSTIRVQLYSNNWL